MSDPVYYSLLAYWDESGGLQLPNDEWGGATLGEMTGFDDYRTCGDYLRANYSMILCHHVVEEGPVGLERVKIEMNFTHDFPGSGMPEYEKIYYDWINHPWGYLLLEDDLPEQYENVHRQWIANTYSTAENIEETNLPREFCDRLQLQINQARSVANMKVLPSDFSPVAFALNEAVMGGNLYYDTDFGFYFPRHDMTASENTVRPVDDEHRTRFHTFDQGEMKLPAAEFNFNRTAVASATDVDEEEIFIDRVNQYIYVVPDSSSPNKETLLGIPVGSIFFLDTPSPTIELSISKPRLIGQITERSGYQRSWGSGYNANIVRYKYDIYWQAGHFSHGDTVKVGLNNQTYSEQRGSDS